ncbi:MAG TPA: GatB/YqeY domain-containing protein [Thermodesulfobacteriota bacterium]
MALKATLKTDLNAAAKAQDKARLSTLRMLLAAVQNREIEVRRELTDGELLETIGRLIKQRQDAIEQFRAGGRADLVEKEEAEVRVLQAYLPAPLSADELAARVDEAIRTAGATSRKDMGKVMKVLLPLIAGRADTRAASELVQQKLAAMGG